MIADYPEASGQIDGGVQAVTSYLVHAMTRYPEIELHVLSFRLGSGRAEVVMEQNFVRYSLPHSKFGTLTIFRQDQENLNAILAEINPDIVHSQGGGHQGILASRSGYPTVVTIHGILTQEAKHLPGFRRRIRARPLETSLFTLGRVVRRWIGNHAALLLLPIYWRRKAIAGFLLPVPVLMPR